jgi:hypothetical protein
MNKKIIMFSISSTILLILISFAPIVISQNYDFEKTIKVQIKKFSDTTIEDDSINLDYESAVELKNVLEELNKAIEERNYQKISEYEEILKDKGIIDRNYKIPLASDKENTKTLDDKNLPASIKKIQKILENDEEGKYNALCYVHATGQGTLIFTIGLILGILFFVLLSKFGFGVISVLIPFYIMVMVATHVIPLRIMLPIGSVSLKQGSISSIGLGGYGKLTTDNNSIQTTLVGFTGLTIHIPFGDSEESDLGGFLFVSGFSAIAYSKYVESSE